MASRYWVGGTGSWNSTNTTNWSATSGGAGGASVPTSADDVFINAASDLDQDLGFTGVCSATTRIATFPTIPAAGRAYRVTTSGAASASVTAITLALTNISTNESTSPTNSGDTDEGSWVFTPGWNITYLGTTYTQIYLNTNSYLSFGSAGSGYLAFDGANPAVPKIMVSAGDGRILKVNTATTGTSPNQIFIIRAEATKDYTNSSTADIIIEYKFPQATPANIEVHVQTNARATTTTTISIDEPAYCLGLTISGVDKTTVITGSWDLNIYGSLSMPNNALLTITHTAAWYFVSTTTGRTINSGGYYLPNISIGEVGAGYTLSSALNSSGFIYFNGGTFTTSASNYAINANSIYYNGVNLQTLTLNGSTITCSVWDMAFDSNTNLTLNAGTSTITGLATFYGGGKTYRNVTFTTATSTSGEISHTNTMLNLTLPSGFTGLYTFTVSASQTITGTFTCSGSASVNRIFVKTVNIGSSMTLTCAAISAMIDVDFRDITIAGAAAPKSGTRLGNCGGNSGITFVAGTNKFWYSTSGGNWSSGFWALTSGGSGSINNFPLAQDTVVLNSTGLTPGQTITIDRPFNIGSIDASSLGSGSIIELLNGVDPIMYGNLTLASGVIFGGLSFPGTIIFSGRLVANITQAGATINCPVRVDAVLGTGIILTESTVISNRFECYSGTVNFNDFNLTATTFFSAYSYSRSFIMGLGSLYLTGSGTVMSTTPSGLTVSGSFKNVYSTYSGSAGRTFSFGNLSQSQAFDVTITAGTGEVRLFNSSIDRIKTAQFQSGFTGSWGINSSGTFYNSLYLTSNMTVTTNGSYTLTFAGTGSSGTEYEQISTQGVAIPANIVLNSTIKNWSLPYDLNLRGRYLQLTAGELDLSGSTVTPRIFYATGTSSKTLTFNSGIINLADEVYGSIGTIWSDTSTNFLILQGTGIGKIQFGSIYGETTFAGNNNQIRANLEIVGPRQVWIQGNNSFNDIITTHQTPLIAFTAGSTTTLTNFTLYKGTETLSPGVSVAGSLEYGRADNTFGSVVLDLSSLVPTGKIISSVTISSIQLRGDLDGTGGFLSTPEQIALSVVGGSGTNTYSSGFNSSTYVTRSWLGGTPTVTNNTITVNYDPTSSVNTSPSGMPNGYFWQVRFNFTISYLEPTDFRELPRLRSTVAGTKFNLSKSSGNVNVTLLDIKDCNVTGGATWYLTYPKDNGNNSGWRYIYTPGGGAFFG